MQTIEIQKHLQHQKTFYSKLFLQKKSLAKKTAQSGSVSQGEIYFGFGRVGSANIFFDHIFHQARSPERLILNT